MQVCGGDALRLFQPEELELLLCGNPQLDFEALERVALVRLWTFVSGLMETE